MLGDARRINGTLVVRRLLQNAAKQPAGRLYDTAWTDIAFDDARCGNDVVACGQALDLKPVEGLTSEFIDEFSVALDHAIY